MKNEQESEKTFIIKYVEYFTAFVSKNAKQTGEVPPSQGEEWEAARMISRII